MLIYVCNTSCLGYTADIIPCLGFVFFYIFFVAKSYQSYPVFRGNFDNSCKLMYYQCLHGNGVTLITFLAF